VVGDFRQNGQTFPFALNRGESTKRSGETPSQGVPGKGLAGHWQGSLRPGAAPVELRLVLYVAAGEGGSLSATVDSIDQGADGIPVSSIALKDDAVTMELAVIKASYEGKLSADGSEIEGTWKQGAIAAPLLFCRLAAEPKLARPQEPKPPFPYQERKVKFPGGASGVTLAGTLTVPPGKGLFPGVVLLSGSGAQDRDGIRKGLAAGGNRAGDSARVAGTESPFPNTARRARSRNTAQLEETMSPEVLQIVSEWIERQTGKEKTG
ncbi:MAG: hypothetical protein ABIR29_06105, partial [Chthoniobacterales bacterium]